MIEMMKYITLFIMSLFMLSLTAYSHGSVDPPTTVDSIVEKGATDSTNMYSGLTGSSEKTDSLENEIQSLKELLKQKDGEIADLKNKSDQLKVSNDSLQRHLINIGLNFLYIPYDYYSIYEVAIPAFQATKGTELYNTYQNRLTLLENYKDDISEIINVLSHMEREMKFTISATRGQKAKDLLNDLYASAVYQRYSSYEKWKGTYLGKRILKIEDLLKSPSQDTPSQLEKIRKVLETQLKTE